MKILYFLERAWPYVLPILYELATRYFKTKKDITIVNNVKKILDLTIPNNLQNHYDKK